LPAGNDIRHRYVFGLAVALGGGGLGLTGATVITTLASVRHASAGSGQIVLAGVRFTYPTVNGAGALLLALGMLGAGVVTLAVRAAWREARAYRRFTAVLQPIEPLKRDPRST
jgi:hypothetical protein